MINAEVVKGVQELLVNRGVHQNPGENLGDFVARGLGISAAEAEGLLAALHAGADVDEALRMAGVQSSVVNRDLLTQMAQAIGSLLGRLNRP